MTGVLLQSNALDLINQSSFDAVVKIHAVEVVEKGYTVIRNGVAPNRCAEILARFKEFQQKNAQIFSENVDVNGRYPRVVNLHTAFPELISLFAENPVWLSVQDLLFGAPTVLYTSLFYQVGSQQSLHRDTPVFSTRPEYRYFGTTVYLEAVDEKNGCLEVMEGGHKIPELDRESMALRRYGSLDNIPSIDGDMWSEYQDTVVELGKRLGLEVKQLHMSPGDSLIWHPQLPHGGAPIVDKQRTRFSLVMHTIPVDTPVYHQNAFFHPSKAFPETAQWRYAEFKGRKYVDMTHGVSFGHVRDYRLDQFVTLDRPTTELD